jgi:Flp pilus assembly protein TadG
VEFALVLPVFLLLLCGVIDFSNVFYNEMTMQNALRQAGRFATTGNTLADPNNPGQNLSRVASIIATAQQAAAGLNMSANSINISSNGTGGTGGAANAGGPGDIITISVTGGVPMLTPVIAPFFPPNGTYNYTVSVTFKNEPWKP